MKIDLTQQYRNSDDTLAFDAETKKPITLKDILKQVCLNDGTKPEDKVKRWNIYRSLKKATTPYILLDAEEVSLLKKAVTETHGVLVVGQTHEMLEASYVEPLAKPTPKVRRSDSDSAEERQSARERDLALKSPPGRDYSPEDYRDVE
jgi:hypothetical protein